MKTLECDWHCGDWDMEGSCPKHPGPYAKAFEDGWRKYTTTPRTTLCPECAESLGYLITCNLGPGDRGAREVKPK